MADRDYLADLRAIAMNGVAQIASGFKKPDADFTPAFMYVDGAGKASIAGIDLRGADDWDAQQRVKDRVARWIEARLRQEHALAASLVVSVWRAPAPPGTPLELAESGRLRPSRMPNRKEALWLQLTDGVRYEMWEADLIRHEGQPPTLGEWKAIPDAEKSEGRFMLLRIFRRAVGHG